MSGEVRNLETRGQKGLAKAHILIFKPGQTNPLYSLSTDKHGLFEENLPPGEDDLLMSHKGLQDVKISDFLVPLENETKLTIKTSRTGAIAVCL